VEELNKLAQCTSVADLGCGVGASLVAVSRMVGSDIHVSGITISAIQAAMIRTHAVTVASFEDLPYADASLDAVWAIESFAHSQRPDRFFAEVARVLRPNGICIICDDMRTTTVTSLFVDSFVHGWMVPNIDNVDTHILRAQSHGLLVRANRDLTHGLSLYSLPESFAQRLMSFLRLIMPNTLFLRSMIGSWALQQCYAANLMSYRFVVFEKSHE
jgi:ubiquinone/menaquinone biosynthesis C-methylase UbiE